MSARVGFGLALISAWASMIMPGMQKPHCAAPPSANARWSGCSGSSPSCLSHGRAKLARPSIVTTSFSPTRPTGSKQDITPRPPSRTVQLPHSPPSHASLAPVRSRSSRSTSIRERRGSTTTTRASPLTLSLTGRSRVSVMTLIKERPVPRQTDRCGATLATLAHPLHLAWFLGGQPRPHLLHEPRDDLGDLLALDRHRADRQPRHLRREHRLELRDHAFHRPDQRRPSHVLVFDRGGNT